MKSIICSMENQKKTHCRDLPPIKMIIWPMSPQHAHCTASLGPGFVQWKSMEANSCSSSKSRWRNTSSSKFRWWNFPRNPTSSTSSSLSPRSATSFLEAAATNLRVSPPVGQINSHWHPPQSSTFLSTPFLLPFLPFDSHSLLEMVLAWCPPLNWALPPPFYVPCSSLHDS